MKMLRGLQVKFVVITMLVLTLVLGGILGMVNISMLNMANDKNNSLLSNMLENEGVYKTVVGQESNLFMPKQKTFDLGAVRNAFAIRYYDVNNTIEIITKFPLHFTDAELTTLLYTVKQGSKTSGNYDGIRYALKKTDYGCLCAFVDGRIDDNTSSRMMRASVFIFIISLLFAMVFSLIMSHWAVIPVKKAFQKQKQFVGDASHELKTPLAVIDTNLSVLEDEVGTNVWCTYIHDEVARMDSLVKDLLFLAKYEDSKKLYEFKEFDISKAILGAVLPFESLAFEKGRILEYDIAENLIYKGDEKRIKQLAVIFLDNAVKHSEETELQKKPLVRLTLRQTGSKIELSVFNTGAGLASDERKKVFERFYRSDSSRNRETGCSGLGLAIASTIAKAHKSKITVNSKVGEWVEFSVLL
ncbi:MAG: hypothetical protein BKP49_08465 [Treponema sp. CETP13]|nr:MAG: hypothetical protein BKP49_08465 [Treponema sp. CETP13]